MGLTGHSKGVLPPRVYPQPSVYDRSPQTPLCSLPFPGHGDKGYRRGAIVGV